MTKQQRISSILTQCRLRFLGYLMRIPDNHLAKQLLMSATVSSKHVVGLRSISEMI